MKLYLVRHGDAVHPAADSTRPLSERGRADITRLAAWLAARDVTVNEIVHSPKRRAVETAQIIGASLRPAAGLREVGGLRPNDDPQLATDSLRFETAPIMAVSHLPLVELIAERLLSGRRSHGSLTFRPGTAAAFDGSDGDWTLEWLVHSDHLE